VQNPAGLYFELYSPWGAARVQSPLLGRFNVSNLLAVLGALLALELPFAEAVDRITSLTTVNGRMQRIQGSVDTQTTAPLVVVDYAHTPDALDKALQSLREHMGTAGRSDAKLWCVFGCGGDRDKAKRAPMGSAAEKGADFVIVTNDNPRREDPHGIINDILAGITDQRRVSVIADRIAAIENAVLGAAAGDAVLIAGKGHETYQIFGKNKQSYPSDAVVAFAALEKRRTAGELS
jgi:UDP-N-acetylmuramoyl-L-alanyl-D-glutamate--2,6-diaminopimelate ligase